MARFETLRLGVWPAHIRTLLRTVALAGVLLLPVAIVAGWLEKIAGTAIRGSAPMSPALETAVRYVRGLPARADVVPLAAQGTPEGHWRFVSKSGEVYTVGTPDEMKRALTVLHPEARTGARLALYMTQDTVLRDRVALKALPAGIDLSVVVGADSYRLLRRSEAAGERFFAEIRPNLVVEMGDKRLFEEAVWQLARPLDAARVRVLALEPGGPATLPTSPRIDPASKRALVDVIDPTNLVPAMRGVAGQTLVMVGRLERDLIYVRPSSGPEHVLVAKDLLKGAAAADVSLVVLLTTSTPRQPGGRNWLWQKVQVRGLDEAVRNTSIADFLNALGSPSRRLAVVALPQGQRTALDLQPAGDLPAAAPARPVAEFLANAVSEVTGRVTATSMLASVRAAARQQELDHRLLPGVPSEVQIGYGLLIVLGLLGVPAARVWWQRVWPPEQADDYAGHTGYWAARAVRGLAFGLLFVPLTAPVSMPCSIGRQVREALTAPARLWRRRVSPGTVGERAPSAPRVAERAPPAPRVAEPVAVPTAAAHRIIDAGARSPGSAVPAGLAEDRPRFLSRR
jgi:hypothetical protein